MSPHHYITYFFVAYGTKQFYFILKYSPLKHLLQVDGFRSRASDDEADVRISG